MILRLLGTGAAEGIPGFFSDGRVSRYAREHRGKDIRSRASALVDGHIKIDLPPDTYMQLTRDGLSALDWSALVFTHAHDDHFAYPELQYSVWPFNELECTPFTIYGNPFIVKEVQDYYEEWPMEVVATHSFVPFEHAAYRITPLAAAHPIEAPGHESHILLFENQGKTLLYATDTGVFPDETFEYLTGRHLDLLVMECTKGFACDDYQWHLGVPDFKAVCEKLRRLGALDDSSQIVSTHHSHNGEATHDELEVALNADGIQVGFDGMEIEV